MSRGKYIVIEGPEGVGKSTQIVLLSQKLKAAGLPVRIFREPDSQSDLTARTIRLMTQDPRYPMNTKTEVLLYNAARSQSLDVIRNSVEAGVYCIVDRNYLTTLAIQYYGRGDIPDYNVINQIISFAVGINEPDYTVILDAPVQVLRARLEGRGSGERFDDLDEEFLDRVRSGYLWEAKQRNYPVVFSTEDPDSVAESIWKLMLPVIANRQSEEKVSSPTASIKEIINEKFESLPTQTESTVSSEPLLEKVGEQYVITEAGRDYLQDIVSDVDGDVYTFTEKLSPTTVAAAMARLSRRGDDMRITILDEFVNTEGKDEKLLQRVITAFGDDSVQQLTGQHFVIEGASNILTKKLEWGRLAAYLEQSTRYIFFDQKDKNGNFKYFVPGNLNKKVKKHYILKMDEIFSIYSGLVRSLSNYLKQTSTTPEAERDGAWRSAIKAQACDAIRPVLPVATKSTVGVFASAQAAESLVMHLQSDELLEAQETGQNLLKQLRKVNSVFYERADKPDRGGAMVAYRSQTAKSLTKLAKKYLPNSYSETTESVTLTNYWPKNEMDLIADMLYEHSSLPLTSLKEEIDAWPIKKKAEVFDAYMGERLNRRHKPGRALEKAHYSWDCVCDYGIFRDLQRHRIVDNLQWQLLTPRYGYDVPKLVEAAGLVDDFEKCFDISLALYSYLQENNYELEAQYATLLGHKMRWQLTFNAREAFHLIELRTSPQGHPGYRKLAQEMYEKIFEVHPLIASAMKFVNQGEDPELTRLAAERYTQFKLSKLK